MFVADNLLKFLFEELLSENNIISNLRAPLLNYIILLILKELFKLDKFNAFIIY